MRGRVHELGIEWCELQEVGVRESEMWAEWPSWDSECPSSRGSVGSGGFGGSGESGESGDPPGSQTLSEHAERRLAETGVDACAVARGDVGARGVDLPAAAPEMYPDDVTR